MHRKHISMPRYKWISGKCGVLSWSKSTYAVIVIVFLVAVAVFRIAGTYHVLSQVDDEGFHIACGMEWLSLGTYTYELQHPPLPRVAAALGPYLLGVRSYGKKEAVAEGNAILNANGAYFRNLTAARAGNMIFLVIACAALAILAWRQYGPLTSVFSVLLFTMLPPILGHAGVATTDLACAAAVILVLAVFIPWLEDPSRRNTLILGVALGIAVLSKFSAPLFLGVSMSVALAAQALTRGIPRPRAFSVVLAIAACFIVIWAGYRFHMTRIIDRPGVQTRVRAMTEPKRTIAESVVSTPLPLMEVVFGMREVAIHNVYGHATYLFGNYSQFGWWYYFPVVIALKTPLSFLVLAIGGGVLMLSRRGNGQRRWPTAAPILFALAMFFVVLPSNINIGVRHILPMYGPLALCGGFVLAQSILWFKTGRRVLPTAAIALVVVLCVESAGAHPDYLAWFNILAGDRPERLLADSNLDWGQDLYRLSERLRVLGVHEVALAYFGNTDVSIAGLPPYRLAKPFEETDGWIAASVRLLELQRAKDGSYAWLACHRPEERIGRSIYLYHLLPH